MNSSNKVYANEKIAQEVAALHEENVGLRSAVNYMKTHQDGMHLQVLSKDHVISSLKSQLAAVQERERSLDTSMNGSAYSVSPKSGVCIYLGCGNNLQ